MDRLVLLVAIVTAIALAAVYAVSISQPEPALHIPPILEQSKCWQRGHSDEVVC